MSLLKKKALMVVFLSSLLCSGAGAVDSDMSDWMPTSINFSGQVLSFMHPGGFSNEFPDNRVVHEINMHNPAIYESGRPVILFEKYWDYKGHFWQGVFGTLSMKVLLYRKPESFEGSVLDLDNLKRLLESLLESEHVPRNKRLRETGQHRFIVELPDEFKRAGPNHDWLYYHIGGQLDSDLYSKPMSDFHYLEVAFRFIDNNRGHKTNWRQDAQLLSTKIMQTMTWETDRVTSAETKAKDP